MRAREKVISELKAAIAEERSALMKVLHLLREVERDEHYLAMGHSTLFDFVTKDLGYSAGSAHRRIQSMRLLKTIPEMEERIEDGSLSLCVAAKTQSFFQQEDRKRRDEGQAKLSSESKTQIVQSMCGASARECEAKLAVLSPESVLPREKARAVAEGKTLIQFTASDPLLAKLEKLKGLLAHQNFEGRYDRLFEILADMALKKLDPEQKPQKKLKQVEDTAVQEETQNETELPTLEKAAVTSRSRYVPAALRRAVWKRDGGRCTYRDPITGRVCESRHALQLDHIYPYGWGGETSESNLRLRCSQHNAFTARRQGLIGLHPK
jgi:5-methylcytosine-specific restriction endonuclease McrA